MYELTFLVVELTSMDLHITGGLCNVYITDGGIGGGGLLR
jgi:hypothetical protein